MPATIEKLTTPPIVQKVLDGWPERDPEALARLEFYLNLSYHYGGQDVVCRGEGDEFQMFFAGTIEETCDWLETQPHGFFDKHGARLERPYRWARLKKEWGIRE